MTSFESLYLKYLDSFRDILVRGESWFFTYRHAQPSAHLITCQITSVFSLKGSFWSMIREIEKLPFDCFIFAINDGNINKELTSGILKRMGAIKYSANEVEAYYYILRKDYKYGKFSASTNRYAQDKNS